MRDRRLTFAEIVQIRASKARGKALAHLYGVDASIISRIRKRGWNPRGPKISAARKINATLATLACTGAA